MHACMHLYTCTHAHKHACMHAQRERERHTHTHTHTHIQTHTHTHTHMHMCTHMHAHICVRAHTHTIPTKSPREQLLFSQVLPDGTYIKPKNDRLMYGGMTSLRASVVGVSSRGLCIATTIAIRYSAVRRQSVIEPG